LLTLLWGEQWVKRGVRAHLRMVRSHRGGVKLPPLEIAARPPKAALATPPPLTGLFFFAREREHLCRARVVYFSPPTLL